MLKRTSGVVTTTRNVLIDAFPVLLEGLRQVSDVIPTPAGPIVKGVVQTMIFIMTKAEEYQKSNRDIYCLSARAAQVLITIINGLEPGITNEVVEGNLTQVKSILEEIKMFMEGKVPTTRLQRFLKASDTINMVDDLNGQLDRAIARFGLATDIAAQLTLPDIREVVTKTKETMTRMQEAVTKMQLILELKDMMQAIERKLLPRVESLLPSDSRCLLGTRQELLADIETWLQSVGDVTTPSIYWLTGVAGCGKSTISRTVIDKAKDLNLPCSWFCFSRDYPDRRSPDKLMTTLALDLISTGDSSFIHQIHNAITKGIDGTRPLLDQMEGFLRGPLAAANQPSQPVVLVWDALDECLDSRATLIALLNLLHTLPQSTKIFLTNRLEDDLDGARNWLIKKTNIRHHDLTFHKDQPDSTLCDIDVFMRAYLKQISAGRPNWPGEDALKALNSIADGLFMIAEFVCRFLDHPQKDCRLKSLLHKDSFDHGGTTIDKLYSWYRAGLHHIFRDDTTHELEQAKIVLATILVVQCLLSGSALANLIQLDIHQVLEILERLSPFLEGGNTASKEHQMYPIRFVHKSMSDFLIFDNVSTTIALQTDLVSVRAYLAPCCLELLKDRVADALRWISSSVI